MIFFAFVIRHNSWFTSFSSYKYFILASITKYLRELVLILSDFIIPCFRGNWFWTDNDTFTFACNANSMAERIEFDEKLMNIGNYLYERRKMLGPQYKSRDKFIDQRMKVKRAIGLAWICVLW